MSHSNQRTFQWDTLYKKMKKFIKNEKAFKSITYISCILCVYRSLKKKYYHLLFSINTVQYIYIYIYVNHATPIFRIVLAGDHMQLEPEVISNFALEKRFNLSLLGKPSLYIVQCKLWQSYFRMCACHQTVNFRPWTFECCHWLKLQRWLTV